jgi:hypothetical protein
MQVRTAGNCRFGGLIALCVVFSGGLPAVAVLGEQVELPPAKDASVYQYEYGTYVAGSPKTYPKADGRSHLHVGDTNNKNGVQRGLIQFDLSGIPGASVVTEASLTITVAGVPYRILQRDVNFWMLAMEGLSGPWNQGPGSEQSPAAPGDATWFHTQYDPAQHGELGNTSGNEFRGFSEGDPGYWPAAGYFGQADLGDTAADVGAGGPFDDAHALVLPEQSLDTGNVVHWSNDRMLSDVQAWVDGSQENFGWILVGEEWITAADQVVRPDTQTLASASSKIDFFSSETAAPYYSPPTLRVTYTPAPEPGCAVLLPCGAVTLLLWRRKQRSR